VKCDLAAASDAHVKEDLRLIQHQNV